MGEPADGCDRPYQMHV